MSHTNTGEWQSFEGRMRRRRAERLLLRADVAADAGCLDEAREALAEARKLVPSMRELDRIQAKIDTPVPPAVPTEAVLEPEAVVPAGGRGRQFVVAAAAIAFLAGGAAALLHGTGRQLSLQPTQEFRDILQPVAPPDTAAASVPGVSAASQRQADSRPVSTMGTAMPEPAPLSRPPQPSFDRSPDSVPASPAIVPASLTSVGEMPAPVRPPAAVAVTPPPVETASAAPMLERVGTRDTSDAPKPPPAIAADPLAATPGTLSAPPDPVVSQDALVRSALDRYAAAYSALDADAAQRVWPSVNRAALSRAFDNLASQRVALGSCSIDVSGATARARCAGSTTWQPKVGSGEVKTDRRAWTFDLARAAGGGWQIVSARVQNR